MTDFYTLEDSGQALAMGRLAECALAQWNLQGSTLELIKYRENAVFSVTTAAGLHYALRIHRHAYHTDAELRSELQWMSALADAGIQVPTLVPTVTGEPFAVVAVDAVPEPRQVDIFEWVDGEQLGSVEQGVRSREAVVENYHTIGRLAAQLHNQAIDWVLPEGFVRHAWDIEGLVGDAPFWGPFWELEALTDAERTLLLERLTELRLERTLLLFLLPRSEEPRTVLPRSLLPERGREVLVALPLEEPLRPRLVLALLLLLSPVLR